jgi:hypothetical protein
MRFATPALLLLALAGPASAAEPWQAETLRLHNEERARWRVAPLAWDLGLAAGADDWAQELARSDRWGHSPREMRRGQGENLWMGTTGAYSIGAMVGGWLGERRWFKPGIFPAVSSTGRWSDVGHYTQMIARRSTRVGCAIRSNPRWTYLVCRYGPSGNVDGVAFP